MSILKKMNEISADSKATKQAFQRLNMSLNSEDIRVLDKWLDLAILCKKARGNNVDLANVSVSLFDESLKLMRDLAEHQNGTPLIRHVKDYNKTMTEVWDFLEANETQ